jgi:hypothetical protein
MLERNENHGIPPIFKPKRVAAVTQLFKDKVEEVMRLQRAGKLPYCKKIPKVIVRTSDIKIIMGVKERQAQRIMAKVRVHAHKTTPQYITVQDFVAATTIDEMIVQRVLDMCT